MKKEPNTVVFTDEEGNEIKVELLFSIVRPETGIRYLFVVDPDDKEGVLVFQAENDDGDILLVDDSVGEDVINYLNETFSRYENDLLEPVEEDDEEEDTEYEYGKYDDEKDDEEDHECCDDCCDCCSSCEEK
ncbi:MAG: hypothetical protein WCR63_03150 [Bacilli bacterium]